jgi:hypothetical protein
MTCGSRSLTRSAAMTDRSGICVARVCWLSFTLSYIASKAPAGAADQCACMDMFICYMVASCKHCCLHSSRWQVRTCSSWSRTVPSLSTIRVPKTPCTGTSRLRSDIRDYTKKQAIRAECLASRTRSRLLLRTGWVLMRVSVLCMSACNHGHKPYIKSRPYRSGYEYSTSNMLNGWTAPWRHGAAVVIQTGLHNVEQDVSF